MIFTAALLVAAAGKFFAQSAPPEECSAQSAPPEEIEKWREQKFGLFIHWGPVSLKGTEIGWSRGGERRGNRGTGEIPVEVYDNLYKEFNPTAFDAREWVRIAQAAGMKYLVFTTRHHDGFTNFDSKWTDYKITNPESPYRKDIVKQLADACHEAGLGFGVYYSQPDWHHPDYRTVNHSRFLEYMHGQVEELCTNYGQIDVIFFDGLGGTSQDWDAVNLFPKIRKLQPRVVINNRCGLPADYDTPEQSIGEMQTARPWETCMTLGRQWAWKPDDDIKSAKECIQTLVKVVGGDGNFLFNVGPMPDGRIEPRQVERLHEIGAWLKRYGESIYGTRGGPFKRGDWGVATRKGDRIYLHLLDPGVEEVSLPALPEKIVGHTVLTGGTAQIVQTEAGIEVTVAKQDRNEIDTIVELNLKSNSSAQRIKAFCIDFNWGPEGFAPPGMYTQASPQEHFEWYRRMGVNTIQTFCVSCPGYAWYNSEIAPVQPGMQGEFLKEITALGHQSGMKVMGYFCVGANTWWSQQHPDLSHPFPSSISIPFTTEYLDHLSRVMEEALSKTGIDGFMIDWVYNASHFYKDKEYSWLECEKRMYQELFGEPFPGGSAMDESRINEFNRRATDRCWEKIRQTAKAARPDCVLWLTAFDLQHPMLVGSNMLREVDWLMNEHPDPEKLEAARGLAGENTRLIQCICGWGGQHDAAKILADPKFAGVGFYGFAKPDPATTLPPEDDSGNARNIAAMREAFND
jgi:alpha-L-fucosidase